MAADFLAYVGAKVCQIFVEVVAQDTTGWIREKMAPSHALNMSLSCLFQKENSGLTTISLLTMIVAFGIAEIPSWKPDRS